MINSRTKGAAAEREVFALISDALGIKVERNLVQTRDGGYHTAVGGWAIEVKRQEILHLPDWWRQCCEQAKNAHFKPMLIYRKSRQPWMARVLTKDLVETYGCLNEAPGIVEIDLPGAISLIRLNFVDICELSPPNFP
jgi:hypothetical protein